MNLKSILKFSLCLFATITLTTSCEDDELLDDQFYLNSAGGFIRNAITDEKISGLPIGIYKGSEDGMIEYYNLNYYELQYRCKTNKEGFYSFTRIWGRKHEYAYSTGAELATVMRETPFDSTKIEWQYFNSSSMEGYMHKPGMTDFSRDLIRDTDTIGGYFEKANGFYVIPAGWVAFNILDFASDTIVIESEGQKSMWYQIRIQQWKDSNREVNYFFCMGYEFALEPSKTHQFSFYKIKNGQQILLKKEDIFVKNSFVHSSIPENLQMKASIIDVNVY